MAVTLQQILGEESARKFLRDHPGYGHVYAGANASPTQAQVEEMRRQLVELAGAPEAEAEEEQT